jgi:hypothetical protein
MFASFMGGLDKSKEKAMSEKSESGKKKSYEVSGNIVKAINVEISDGMKDSRTWSEMVTYFIDFTGVEREDLLKLAARPAVIAVAAKNRDSRESARKINGTKIIWKEFAAERKARGPASAEEVGNLLVKKLEDGSVESIEAMIAKLEALKAAKSTSE